MYTFDASPCSHIMDLVNAIDESLATAKHLAELAPAIDDGSEQYFSHAIELLNLIAREVGHVEKLMSQLSACLLPRPRRTEGGAR